MLASKAFVFSLMATTLAVCIAAPVFVLQASPYMQPGQNWTGGLLMGEDLRLLDSGRYVSRPWCDICPRDTFSYGSWRRSGDVIVLHADRPGVPERRLCAATIRNCPMLIPLDQKNPVKWISPGVVFGRDGERCVGRLDRDGHTGRLLRGLSCLKPERKPD
ncbi:MULTISPECIES: hypothetical protein [Lysobacter]|uniref:hypothetical protein n=1 Tax=Lysobacter TaxID=68 RepID=UPI001F325145|nr:MULTISPECIES: hypothetical protein [Lysobacter]UJB19993.1 hypothetical protein L1A79_02555 [Lysobacter capsici]UJQ30892.1 hypothetical protein L2D09_12305 [Lysobacter gummosus]